MARTILVLYAHPSPERSQINSDLAAIAHATRGVTLVDLYALYPTFDIDVDVEQARLLEHDVVVFLHPLYWYSTPSILKEWQDLVLEYGFAYGHEGKALRGKLFFCAVSAGGPQSAYGEKGYNQYPLRTLMTPLEQTATLCSMVYLPPFALFGARTASDDGRAPAHAAGWRALLEAVRDDRLDLAAARRAPLLNAAVEGSAPRP